MKKMRLGKAFGLSEVSMEIINASEKVGIDVTTKLCQRVLDGKEMPEDCKTSLMTPIYKGKGDGTNCGVYRGVKLLEHGMKIVKKILKKMIRALVEVNNMQFGIMPEKGTTEALFIVRKVQEKYRKKNKKLFVCFVDL